MQFLFILYFAFGVLPSLIWLGYYLRKDAHPESKRMILKVFLWGAIITVPTFLVQVVLAYLLRESGISGTVANFIYFFVVIALTEEILKFLVVRDKIIKSPHLDEPLDVMLYMVVGALGFAAVENIMYLMAPSEHMAFNDVLNRTVVLTLVRFLGSTFLHTLASGTIGYFLAKSFRDTERRGVNVFYGIFLAVTLHGVYNISIMLAKDSLKLIIPVAVIVFLAYFVFYSFAKLRKDKGLCFAGNCEGQ